MGISERWHLRIEGTVQGVGFRPFVYRTAVDLGLVGLVRNTPKGVSIEAQGDAATLNSFIDELRTKLPPLAEIHSLTHEVIEPSNDAAFVIETSASGTEDITPSISPDIATCDDCLNELMSSRDRRHGYAFTNCTNCGPRYTIIEGFPYDRPLTSMKNFEMCPACNAEYNDPANRRFHAQPNACEECGPELVLSYSSTLVQKPYGVSQSTRVLEYQSTENVSNAPITRAIDLLSRGHIIAIKGLGGYHLACDATNDEAVGKLRERKQRDMKPFAIMVRDLEAARALCEISDDEAKILTSPRRPIVLLMKKEDSPIADSVAPGNNCLGIMLPYTPLHHLLFVSRPPSPVSLYFVMTSANFSEEPIIADDEEAKRRLSTIADAFLTHDRPIHMRTDDSVVRHVDGETIVIRRSRGYVPQSIELPFDGPNVLAAGGDIKNVLCLTSGGNAYLSQHIGDLENAETHAHFEHTIDHLCSLLKIEPEIISCDMHPDYFSSTYSRSYVRSYFRKRGLSKERTYESTNAHVVVQHHHAHIASCMAENKLENQKVIGIALDGAGYGPDGTIWGGEILRCDYSGYERIGRFKPVPQPGGDRAAKETWRMAVAHLRGLSAISSQLSAKTVLNNIPEHEIELVQQALDKNINCPLTSSCGRLFDAVAAITGLATHNAYEGQGAMMLEHAASPDAMKSYHFEIHAGEPCDIDFTRMMAAIVDDVRNNVDVSVISAKFHNTIAIALVRMVESVIKDEAVVLSGGCFQNAYLLTNLTNALEARGKTVYRHRLVPPNDGGIALGQAAVAAYRHNSK